MQGGIFCTTLYRWSVTPWGMEMGSHYKIHYFFILFGSMVFMLASRAAYAQERNILGTVQKKLNHNNKQKKYYG